MTLKPFQKIALNAEYPAMGAKFIPFHDQKLAQNVTDTAQKLLFSGTYGKMNLPPRHPATNIGE